MADKKDSTTASARLMGRSIAELRRQIGTDKDCRSILKTMVDPLFRALEQFDPNTQPLQREFARRLLCGALFGMGSAEADGKDG